MKINLIRRYEKWEFYMYKCPANHTYKTGKTFILARPKKSWFGKIMEMLTS